jgi:selenocysteine lyase/cysteine desulfurase
MNIAGARQVCQVSCVSLAQGEPRGVRLSAHLYVSPADIDRVLNVVG